jgi:hypothetical protein
MTIEQQKLALEILLVCWQSISAKKEILLVGRKEITLSQYIEKQLKKCGYKVKIID